MALVRVSKGMWVWGGGCIFSGYTFPHLLNFNFV